MSARGEQDGRREPIDLVEHHLVAEYNGPHQLHVQALVRLDPCRAEGGLAIWALV